MKNFKNVFILGQSLLMTFLIHPKFNIAGNSGDFTPWMNNNLNRFINLNYKSQTLLQARLLIILGNQTRISFQLNQINNLITVVKT